MQGMEGVLGGVSGRAGKGVKASGGVRNRRDAKATVSENVLDGDGVSMLACM